METAFHDLRHALRVLRKSPGFTGVAILTLALGMGANTALFSVVHSVLLRPLPYRDAGRLVAVWSSDAARGFEEFGSSPPDYRELRDGNATLAGTAAYYTGQLNLAGSEDPERVDAAFVTAGLLPLLGTPPLLGRGFVPDEERFGSHRVVVLSHPLWQRRFGGARTIVGSTIRLEGEPYTVVGVMPRGFQFPTADAQAWVPMAFAKGDPLDTRGNYFLSIVGRLEPGITAARAEADLERVVRSIRERNPSAAISGARVESLRESMVGDVRRALLVLLGAAALVLLIACANVANLTLLRGASREREMALRAGLGAGRARLVRQLLTESLVLAVAGGLLGLLVALWGVPLLKAAAPATLPRLGEIQVDLRVLAFTAAVSFLTALLFGLAPALHSARLDLNRALREGGRAQIGTPRALGRQALVVAQVALALVLLVGAGLLVRSFQQVTEVDSGVNTDGVLTLSIALPRAKYPDKPAADAFFAQALERLRTLPGVRSAAVSSGLPLGGEQWTKLLTLADRPAPRSLEEVPSVAYRLVSADYFRTFGVPLLRGRAFQPEDGSGTQPVAVINESARRRFWGDEDPIGKRLWMGPPESLIADWLPADYRFPRLTVVGVVRDEKLAGLDQPAQPEIYQLVAQSTEQSSETFIALKTLSDPATLVPAARAAVSAVDPDQAVGAVRTMHDIVGRSLTERRFQTLLLGLFAVVALVLATVGIYGVLAYSVGQRTREMGLRMALGARHADILRLVVGGGLALVVGGVVLGVAGALALTRLAKSLLFGVSPTDPATFAAVAVTLTAVGLLASYLPARRAAGVHPMDALRRE